LGCLVGIPLPEEALPTYSLGWWRLKGVNNQEKWLGQIKQVRTMDFWEENRHGDLLNNIFLVG
jgi:hypothetical protein